VGKAQRAHHSRNNFQEKVGTLRFAHPTDFFVQATTESRERALVTEWHSKFHAAARGIEATPLKKWMVR